MEPDQYAMMWALVASGAAGRPGVSAAAVADIADKVIAEYERRHPRPVRGERTPDEHGPEL